MQAEYVQVDYQTLLSNINDGVYFTDTERRIIYWNEAAERITGYSAAEVIGHRCSDNVLIHVDADGRSLCLGRCPLAEAIRDRTARRALVYLHHKQGHRLPVHVRVTPLIDTSGRLIGGAEFFSDASDQEAMRSRIAELEHLALLDPLTGLPNRNHIEAELASRTSEMERMGIHFGLLFMDIDHFKLVNDTHGHDAGDKVLQMVANTLKATLRPYDMAGRWGGEEFVVVIRNVDENQLAHISSRYYRLIGSSSVTWESNELQVTVSMGATMANPDDTGGSLIQRADRLMYASKNNGRNRITMG
jgi:diguanylate cyclase (GGDEF)-like protein/PAS domain S-box-containing protein